MSDTKIATCPFCGQNNSVHVTRMGSSSWLTIQCRSCEGSGPWKQNEEEAIAAWNQRAAAPSIPSGSTLALSLAIQALEAEPPTGKEWPVNWPVIVYGLKQLKHAIELGAPANSLGQRDTQWTMAIAHALGTNSGFQVPLVPLEDSFKALFAANIKRHDNPPLPELGPNEVRSVLVKRPDGGRQFFVESATHKLPDGWERLPMGPTCG